MTLGEPGADLAESTKALQVTLQMLKTELASPAVSVESRLRNLSAVMKILDQTKPTAPILDSGEYLNDWNELLAGRRENLEPRAIRSLCWNATIATQQSFQN